MTVPTISKDEVWFLQRKTEGGWYGIGTIIAAPLPSLALHQHMKADSNVYFEIDVRLIYADDVALIDRIIGGQETLYMRATFMGQHVGGARITVHGRTMLIPPEGLTHKEHAEFMDHKLYGRIVALGKFK